MSLLERERERERENERLREVGGGERFNHQGVKLSIQ